MLLYACVAFVIFRAVASDSSPRFPNQDWDGGLWQSYYHPLETAPGGRVGGALWFPNFLKNMFSPNSDGRAQLLDSENVDNALPDKTETIDGDVFNRTTEHKCKGDHDCHKIDVTLSCMGATPDSQGECMLPLKPMEHGCVFNDQCQKTCVESFCATEGKFKNAKGENQCRCQKGYYYLWKKCWNNCLPGTSPLRLDEDHWVCRERNASEARLYLHRNKRQAYRRLVC